MKKYTVSLLAAAVFAASAAHADEFSITGGLDYMYSDMNGTANGYGNSDNQSLWSTYVDFRHPLVNVPNFNFQASDLSSGGAGYSNDLKAYDFALYYSPFQMNSTIVNLGADLRRYDGDLNGHGYSNDNIMLYSSAETTFDGTDFGAFADARVAYWDGDHSHDWKVGVDYTVFPQDTLKFKVRAGYRNARIDVQNDGMDINQHLSNLFVGAQLRY